MKEYLGWNTLSNIEDALRELGSKNILLVTGRSSYAACGAKAILDSILMSYTVTHFPVFTELPNLETITQGIECAREKKIDTVIGLGGGNALDTAKSIALLAPQETNDYAEIITKNSPVTKSALAKILIPTTAGTGSEATHFAVVYINKEKYSLAHPSALPEYAIIDPSLTLSLSPYVTACTGMDALAQAIEAFWSVNSTEESKRYSREAIRLILPTIAEVVIYGYKDAREAMLYGSHLAGKAINIARTTAPHALSYPFTAHYGIPHGHAVGLTLPAFMGYNGLCDRIVDKRGENYVCSMLLELYGLLGAQTAEDAKKKIEHLMDAIQLQRRLSSWGITSENLAVLLQGVNEERLANNPCTIMRKDAEKILKEII